MGGRRDSNRAVQGAREIGRQRGRDRSCGLKAADLRQLHGCQLAGAQLDRALGVRGAGDALVRRDRDGGLAPHQGHVLELRRRLLGELDPVALHRGEPQHRLLRRPGAVRVDPNPRLGPQHRPHRLHLADVARDTHLELEGLKAALRPALGFRRDGARGPGDEGRVAGDRRGGSRAEHSPRRVVLPFGLQVEQRHLQGGPGGRQEALDELAARLA